MTDANDPILAALRDANPVPDPRRLAGESTDALFQEITMTTSTDAANARDFGPAPTKDEIAPRRARRKRGVALTGAAAATAAAVGFGVVAFGPGSVPEAHAAMISAAENTDAARSGTAVITVTTDAEGGHEFVLTTAFDGSDLSASVSGDDLASEIGGTPELRVVGGTIYVSDGDQWYSIDDPRIADFLSAAGMPVDVRNTLSDGIVELVKSASNVEQLDARHYRATVTVGEAQRLAADFPSLGVFTDRIGSEQLPADVADQPLDIDLVLDDNGLIDVVTIDADAVDPSTGEAMSGSISIDLNDLGITQTIEAPADAQPMDMGRMLGGN
ncbi:MAG: hypothetical protein R2733_12615 [Acidimicrobiales bacterium]